MAVELAVSVAEGVGAPVDEAELVRACEGVAVAERLGVPLGVGTLLPLADRVTPGVKLGLCVAVRVPAALGVPDGV